MRLVVWLACGWVGIVANAAAPAADGVPLLHAVGDDAQDRTALVESSDPVFTTTLQEVLADRAPTMVGGGSVSVCASTPSSNAQIADRAERAEGALSYMEYGRARAELDAGVQAFGCLSERVEIKGAARLFLLRGVLAHVQEDSLGARRAFRQALSLSADLAWDENLDPGARSAFETVRSGRAEATPAVFAIIPGVPQGALWVDGEPHRGGSAVSLTPGPHLLQLGAGGMFSLRITVPDGGSAAVVIPAAVPDGAIRWVGTAEGRHALAYVLGVAYPEGRSFAVTLGAGLWRGVVGQPDDWQELLAFETRPEAPSLIGAYVIAAPASPEVPRRSTVGVRWLRIGGGGLLVGGAALGMMGFAEASSAAADGATAEDETAYLASEERYDVAAKRYRLGLALAGSGVAVAGMSFAIDSTAGFQVFPTLMGSATGVAVGIGIVR